MNKSALLYKHKQLIIAPKLFKNYSIIASVLEKTNIGELTEVKVIYKQLYQTMNEN